jgi:cell division protein FtsW
MIHRHPNVAKHIFFPLFTVSIFLSIIGLLFIFESSSVRSFNEYSDSFYYLKRQSIFLIPALALFFFLSNFDYRKLYYLSFPIMITTMIFLVIVLIPSIGNRVGGARRWIDLGFFNIQPTELAKFSIILYLSSWFMRKETKRFYSFLFFIGILMFLIILQPDMGTATIIFFLSICIYFIAGEDLFKLIIFLPLSAGMSYMLIKLSPYRFNRLLAFFDPSRDPLGITYHINQIMISLTNGGLMGQGLGASRQKYMFLPEAHTDSIFAIISEEVGFFGSVILIFGFIYLTFKLYQIAKYAPDRFGKLLAGGIFALFSLQIIINLAAMVNLVPLTGIPLPFISYGGSNLLISFSLLGIMINIGKKIKTV